MGKRTRIRAALALLLTISASTDVCAEQTDENVEVVVYGGTPAGIAAAVSASRLGSTVVLIVPGDHIGGMMTAGLNASDVGREETIGGFAREIFQRLGKYYGKPIVWNFESKVALQQFRTVLDEQKIDLRPRFELDKVVREQNQITSIHAKDGRTVRGKVFVDSSYEGDLMARAKVSYRVGREGRDEFKESLAGVYTAKRIDAFDLPLSPKDASGRLLPGIRLTPLPIDGAADNGVPAYNFRLCVTKRPQNSLPLLKPADYDPNQFEIMGRYLEAKPKLKLKDLFNFLDLPNGKFDLNNRGPISTDLIGGSVEYPDGTFERRREIFREHERYTRGLLWFLLTSERVPKFIREEMKEWGLCRDEFVESNNWPPQLYIREARRMNGSYILTERDVREDRRKADSIGIGSRPIESHHVQRYVTADGSLQNEGFVYTRSEGPIPYELPYRSITPKREEVANLLVPVALSSTHIAFSSIRMEPVFMILGQSAGTAAYLAAKNTAAVQDISVTTLQQLLREHGQILTF